MKTIFEIYESIILEAMSLEDIYEKYYKNDIKDIKNFKKIAEIDPTSTPTKKGKYLDWLIKHAYKQNPERLLEDAAKIKEYLTLFDKNYRHINRQITQVKDQQELSELVEKFKEKKDAREIDLSKSEAKSGAEKLYDDPQWTIIHPKTKEAACYYGRNTEWCTAATTSYNYFDSYNEKGPLYIIINKKVPTEKYQLHFQEEQFMNSNDKEVELLPPFPEALIKKLIKFAEDNECVGYFIKLLDSITLNSDKIKDTLLKELKTKYSKELDIFDNTKKLYNATTLGRTVDLNEVKYYIDNGADVNNRDGILLRGAIESRNDDLLKLLIDYGKADVTRKTLEYYLLNTRMNTLYDMFIYLVSKCEDKHVCKKLRGDINEPIIFDIISETTAKFDNNKSEYRKILNYFIENNYQLDEDNFSNNSVLFILIYKNLYKEAIKTIDRIHMSDYATLHVFFSNIYVRYLSDNEHFATIYTLLQKLVKYTPNAEFELENAFTLIIKEEVGIGHSGHSDRYNKLLDIFIKNKYIDLSTTAQTMFFLTIAISAANYYAIKEIIKHGATSIKQYNDELIMQAAYGDDSNYRSLEVLLEAGLILTKKLKDDIESKIEEFKNTSKALDRYITVNFLNKWVKK